MKVAIRYYSRGGHTAKVAKAMAEAIGVEALTTDQPLKEDVDILLLGSAVYAGKVDYRIQDFIAALDVKVGKVVNFSTAAMGKGTNKQVGKLLSEKGIALADESFFCKGAFGPVNKGRPNEEDLKAAAEFAKGLAG